VSNIYSNN